MQILMRFAWYEIYESEARCRIPFLFAQKQKSLHLSFSKYYTCGNTRTCRQYRWKSWIKELPDVLVWKRVSLIFVYWKVDPFGSNFGPVRSIGSFHCYLSVLSDQDRRRRSLENEKRKQNSICSQSQTCQSVSSLYVPGFLEPPVPRWLWFSFCLTLRFAVRGACRWCWAPFDPLLSGFLCRRLLAVRQIPNPSVRRVSNSLIFL